MAVCSHCGTENTGAFCTGCGAALGVPGYSAPAMAVAQSGPAPSGLGWFPYILTKRYLAFSGRAGRSEYWYFVLGSFIAICVLSLAGAILRMGASNPLVALYSLATILPNLGVGARRLHDTGRSGWWLLLGLIPFLGGLVLIFFFIQESQPGPNQYGPHPRAQLG